MSLYASKFLPRTQTRQRCRPTHTCRYWSGKQKRTRRKKKQKIPAAGEAQFREQGTSVRRSSSSRSAARRYLAYLLLRPFAISSSSSLVDSLVQGYRIVNKRAREHQPPPVLGDRTELATEHCSSAAIPNCCNAAAAAAAPRAPTSASPPPPRRARSGRRRDRGPYARAERLAPAAVVLLSLMNGVGHCARVGWLPERRASRF